MGLYDGNMTRPVFKSKGVKQRTHRVKIIAGVICVRHSSLKDKIGIADDAYAFEKHLIRKVEVESRLAPG